MTSTIFMFKIQIYFSIGRYSGVLTVINTLDREILANIVFDISASDQGNPMLFRWSVCDIKMI